MQLVRGLGEALPPIVFPVKRRTDPSFGMDVICVPPPPPPPQILCAHPTAMIVKTAAATEFLSNEGEGGSRHKEESCLFARSLHGGHAAVSFFSIWVLDSSGRVNTRQDHVLQPIVGMTISPGGNKRQHGERTHLIKSTAFGVEVVVEGIYLLGRPTSMELLFSPTVYPPLEGEAQ